MSDLGAGPAHGMEEMVRPPPPDVPRRAARLVPYLLTLFCLVTLNFFLPRALPGDPITAMTAGATAHPAQRKALERYYGLDRPLAEQYLRYLGALVRGDLGVSIGHNRQVAGLLAERLPWTLLLSVSALALATGVGVTAGVRSGWRRAHRADSGLLALFVGSLSVPPFFLASLALFVFSVSLGWFPLSGATTPFPTSTGVLATVVDVAYHLVLPATTLAVALVGTPYLLMRGGMVSELGSDYLVLGRAKGLRPRRLRYAHAARNALLPVVGATALGFIGIVNAGAIFVESVFAYPGVGLLLLESSRTRDYPLLQGCFLALSLTVVAGNFLADVVYRRLDPRITR